MSNHIILIDDDIELTALIDEFLSSHHYHIKVFNKPEKAVDVIVMDPNYEDGTKHEPLTYGELQNIEDSNDTTSIAEVTSEDGEIYVDFSKEFKENNR